MHSATVIDNNQYAHSTPSFPQGLALFSIGKAFWNNFWKAIMKNPALTVPYWVKLVREAYDWNTKIFIRYFNFYHQF